MNAVGRKVYLAKLNKPVRLGKYMCIMVSRNYSTAKIIFYFLTAKKVLTIKELYNMLYVAIVCC